MKPSRVLQILTAVLASATFASAQSPSAVSPEAIRAVATQPSAQGVVLERYFPFPYPVTNLQVPVAAEPQCCWFTQAVQHSVAAFQRVRAMCGSQAKAEPACGICPAAGCSAGHQVGRIFRIYISPAFLPQEPATGCCAGEPTTPFMKAIQTPPRVCHQSNGMTLYWGPGGDSYSGIKDLIQFYNPVPVQTQTIQVVKTPAPCCCAKACACCEACKAKPVQGTFEWVPSMKRVIVVPAQSLPTPTPSCGLAQLVQQATTPKGPPAGLIAQVLIPALPRFETPDLEAHCQKITHRSDTVILEGSVLLLVKKHAQPVRVNAERVIVNMKDGSYTIETARSITTSSFGVMQPSPISLPFPVMPVSRDECEVPKQRIIEIVPVPSVFPR